MSTAISQFGRCANSTIDDRIMTAFCGMIDQSIVILNFSSDLLLKVQNSSKDQPMPTSAARERKSVLDGVAYTTARKAAVEDVKAIEAEWLKQVLDVNGPSDAKHLRKTVRPLLKAMGKYSPAAIDLRGLKPESVNGRHLAVILRTTAARKTETLGWDAALGVARQALLKQGVSADDVLVGLE